MDKIFVVYTDANRREPALDALCVHAINNNLAGRAHAAELCEGHRDARVFYGEELKVIRKRTEIEFPDKPTEKDIDDE